MEEHTFDRIDTAPETGNTTEPYLKQFVPDLTQPLKATLFSKYFLQKQTSQPAFSIDTSFINKSSTCHSELVTIVTSRGESIKVRQRRVSDPSTEGTGDNPEDGRFFGVDVKVLLDMCPVSTKKTLSPPVSPNCKLAFDRVATTKKTLLWSEKYRAKRFTDLVGDERTHRQVMRWLKEWDQVVFPSNHRPRLARDTIIEQERKKILLIHGPPGLGKTTLAHVAARQAGYEPLEINASDDRSASVVQGKIRDMLTIEGVKSCGLTSGRQNKIVNRPVCIIIDEVDGVSGSGSGDSSFIKALVDLVLADQRSAIKSMSKKNERKRNFKLLRPIIAVCNDLYVAPLKPLRALAEVVQMRIPPKRLMEERIEWIFEKEGFATEDGAIRKLVELSCVGTQGGDMRSALVSAEWLSSKLRQSSAATTKNRKLITRQIVDSEFGGSIAEKSEWNRTGGGKIGVREVVESVFSIEKNKGKSKHGQKMGSASKILHTVDALAEFDRITMDCFLSYPTRSFHDDSRLSKPNLAYEWLWFSDLLSARAFNDQLYELAHYLSFPMVAFHYMFASSNTSGLLLKDDTMGSSPFCGPGADWEAYERSKENKSIIQSIHSSLTSIRLALTFKSPSIVMELAPYVNFMLSPRVNPVIVGGSSYGIASVRKIGEKILLNRAVNAMKATGINFEKIKIEIGSGEMSTTGWAFRMEPSADSLGMYPTYRAAMGEHQPVRYAVRQILDQEWKKSGLLREQISKEDRMGNTISKSTACAMHNNENLLGNLPKRKPENPNMKVKRDFFGRVLVVRRDGEADQLSHKRRKIANEDNGFAEKEVWVSFHEGFSNAVRKGIRLTDLIEGLI